MQHLDTYLYAGNMLLTYVVTYVHGHSVTDKHAFDGREKERKKKKKVFFLHSLGVHQILQSSLARRALGLLLLGLRRATDLLVAELDEAGPEVGPLDARVPVRGLRQPVGVDELVQSRDRGDGARLQRRSLGLFPALASSRRQQPAHGSRVEGGEGGGGGRGIPAICDEMSTKYGLIKRENHVYSSAKHAGPYSP